MTWKTFVRPVLVLLVIGVIIGLGAIYINIDDGNVNAESNDEIIEGEEGSNIGDEITPETEVPEEVAPDVSQDEETNTAPVEDIGISGDLRVVLDMGKGYVVITGDESSTHIRYIESGEVRGEKSITLPYVTAGVGRYGLAVVVRDADDSLVYVYDSALLETGCHRIEGTVGYVHIFDVDKLSLLYERVGGISSVMYADETTSNSILDIENALRVKAIYNTGYGDAYVIFENGLIVNTLPTIWRTRLTLGYDIEDIRPIMYEGEIAYAVLDKSTIDRHIHIYSRDFRHRHSESTKGTEMICTNTLYTMNSIAHTLDVFCDCGRLTERIETDIARVTYIDYGTERIYYETISGKNYMSPFDDLGDRTEQTASVFYINDEFMIYHDDVLRLKFA